MAGTPSKKATYPCNSMCPMEEKSFSQNRLRRGLAATDDKNAPIRYMVSRSAKHRPSNKFRSYKKAPISSGLFLFSFAQKFQNIQKRKGE